MNRRAFTLIELMVSIALTVIIVFFLYKALSSQQISNAVLQKRTSAMKNRDKIFYLLYLDIKESNSTKIAKTFNKDYSILYVDTKNSLHNLSFSHVVYYVNAKKKTLVRLESSRKISLPIKLEDLPFIYINILGQNVEKFRIFSQQFSARQIRPLLPGEASTKSVKKEKKVKHLLFFVKFSHAKLLLEL